MASTIIIITEDPNLVERFDRAVTPLKMKVKSSPASAYVGQVASGAAVIFDAGCPGLEDNELLTAVGFAKAQGAQPAVVLSAKRPRTEEFTNALEDLCLGLVVRQPSDEARIAATLVRRSDAKRTQQFESVSVAPNAKDVLAIYKDGEAVLLPRPLDIEDDKSDIVSVEISGNQTAAMLKLSSGKRIRLDALVQGVDSRRSMRPSMTENGRKSQRPSKPPSANVEPTRVGARIRDYRVAAGLTQAELAKRTGIHRPNIARVEAGRHTPSLETLAKLSSAMGVSTIALLTDES